MSDPRPQDSPLVTTQWVSEHLDDTSIVLVEVNTDLQAGYRQGHVPGAVGWGLHTDLEDQVRRDLPGVRQFEELLGRSGIDNDSAVVLYGDGNNRSATWAFWVLKYYRHPDVRLMDGGRKKWLDEGRPLTLDEPRPAGRTYKAPPPDRTLRATKEYILEHLRDPSMKLLDTRSPEEYRGALTSALGAPQPDILRRGHIPGAVRVEWEDAAADNGAFLDVEELHRMYSAAGFDPANEAVAYCRLGVRASYSWFVLKYLLGFPRVRNYDGSWTEWGNSIGAPIETGDAPGTW